ncbi:hypothetical protein [Parahaliea aestuarii]|uniref:Multidrug transporter n=1 Tax=Parahaliea aestuarii TaxID=1852021 RepID=A0A5C8ZY34_9GAMM|nr:hypothetical protein [Parahaliea aestuarii]TXS92430.1 hypothetical protein FVW59_08390 [Parahaliea aestuarii]
MKITAVTRRLPTAVLVGSLALPQMLWAQAAVDESPSAGAMVGDLLVARPMGLVATVGGTAAFLVSLPFTLLAGHASEAAETLMVGPARTTFMRCLGCTENGYTNKDVERYREMQGDDSGE